MGVVRVGRRRDPGCAGRPRLDPASAIGTGYFGCRDRNGRFDLGRLADLCAEHPVRAIEIKLSQGAKPGLGGVLPAAKVIPEIAAARGIQPGRDCRSPSAHSAFSDIDSLLDFVETIAGRTGLPVGIKSAVGSVTFWDTPAGSMSGTGRGVDFITVDGGEGGTGDAPLAFSDHVSLPFKLAISRVYRAFAERGLTGDVVFIGSGRLGMPETALLAMALGCDMINVAREAMLAIGCIQAPDAGLGADGRSIGALVALRGVMCWKPSRGGRPEHLQGN